MDVYVLDENLEPIGLFDAYRSLIWANRYDKAGDCELYVEASEENVALLRMGNYLTRYDGNDSMTCRINKIELDTDAEAGNYLIVTGTDSKSLLDQRIIWSMMNADGNTEDFIRSMVNLTCINPNLPARKMLKENGQPLVQLGNSAGFTEVTTEQITYKNVGEKIREYCTSNNWGYRFVLDNETLWFQLYKGTDRTNEVIFSDQYENLSSTKYVDDATNMGNVALVAGSGEGSERSRNVSGYAESSDRYELYVDAKDIAQNITWAELTEMYPTTGSGGQGYIASYGGGYVYKMNYLNVQIVDADQLTHNYPDGQKITIDGAEYYQVYNAIIANLPSNTPQNDDSVELWAIVYEIYLLNRGYEKLAEYGEKISFEGSIIPDITFVYKQDYFLGDIVSVENEYGIKANARIVEIVEVNDENGYSVEPKFEYLNTYQAEHLIFSNYQLETEGVDTAKIITEAGDNLLSEQKYAITRSGAVVEVASDSPSGDGKKISELDDIGDISKTDCILVSTGGFSKKASFSGMIDFFYPVGSYYETSDSSFNPNTEWGGTWVRETEGLVHIGSGSNYAVGATGGEKTHQLTKAESGLPSHGHGFTQPIISSHKHTMSNDTYVLTSNASSGFTRSNAGSGSAVTNVIRNTASNGTINRGSNETQNAQPTASGGAVNDNNGADASTAHNNMQPYIVVNRWHRTA